MKHVIFRVLASAVVLTFAAACERPQANTQAPDPLLEPSPADLAQAAPDSFRVSFQTSRGPFAVMVHRDWAPNGADRFYYLVTHSFYDSTRFFRTVDGFMTQFGMNGNPDVTAVWQDMRIPDDSARHSNLRGVMSFASGGPKSRTTQLFINLVDNQRLDTMGGVGYPPIGEVVEGMAVVDSLYSGYGEGAPRGNGPRQDLITSEGNEYLARDFPKLDYIVHASVEREWR